MKTKCLAMMLMLAMLVPALAACGNTVPDETDPGTGVETPEQPASDEPASDEPASDEPASDEPETKPETETEAPARNPETLSLVTDGVSEYVIVRGENASELEVTASTELQSYLKQITGAELPIVADTTDPAAKEIVIGQTNREADGAIARDKLGQDGFIIRAEGGKLWLAGGEERGTLYAVYEFLEAYLGCRFYTADFEKVPETKTVVVELAEDKQIPLFLNRNIYWYDMMSDPILKNKRKLAVGTWTSGGMCHTLPYLAETGDGYGPDPCLLKEETYDTVLKNVRALLEATPNADFISISQADGDAYCRCRDCKASAKKLGWSGHYLTFVNRIAEEIADEYPNVLIHTFAYTFTEEPPLTDIVPADNVMVQLCTIMGCRYHPLTECDSESHTDYVPLFEKWSKISNYLAVWDYTTNFYSYSSLYPNFQVLQPNIRFFAENGVMCLFEEGNGSSTNGEFSELRSYLLARLAWDPYMSEEEYTGYMHEFMADYYGPGWENILAYIEAGTQYLEGTHLGIAPWVDKIYPTVTEETGHSRNDIPADITLEMLLDYENTDWSPYYEWVAAYRTVDFISEGYKQFAAAMEMAETEEQRAHIDKSSIQLDLMDMYTRYLRLTNAATPIVWIYKNLMDQHIANGAVEFSEGMALYVAFQTYIRTTLMQELENANRALAEKMIAYKAYSIGSGKNMTADMLDELNFQGVPTGYPEWFGQ